MNEASSETVVPASLDETWESITQAEQLEEWLGDDVNIEFEPGGEVTVRDGEDERTGFVEEIAEPRRLVFWWSTDGADSTRVAIDLAPAEGGTRVRVVESRPLAVLDAPGGPADMRLEAPVAVA